MGKGCSGKCPDCKKQAAEAAQAEALIQLNGKNVRAERAEAPATSERPTAGELIDALAHTAPLMV